MSSFNLPTDPDLWYNKDRELVMIEQEEMAAACPYAVLGFMISIKALYWMVKIPVGNTEYQFMLLYHKDYPNKTNGVSISVLPVYPDADKLRGCLKNDAEKFFSTDPIVKKPCIVLPVSDREYNSSSEYYQTLVSFLNRMKK